MNYWESERIRLRGLEPADAALFHAWNSDSEMSRNLDFLWPPSSLAGVKNWLETRIQKGAENDEIYCIIETKSGDFVGSIGSHTCGRMLEYEQFQIDGCAMGRCIMHAQGTN